MPRTSSLTAFEHRVGRHLGVHRSYFSADQIDEMMATVRDDYANSRLSIVSTKCPGTWAQVADGSFDGWLRSILEKLGAESHPLMLALHHEPENDVDADGMTSYSWVAMQQRAIRMAQVSAPKVTIIPILMHFTFDAASGREPREWMVPQSTVFGLDVYNHWSVANPGNWSEFGAQVDRVQPWAENKPIIIAEYGCRSDPNTPGRAVTWMRDAYSYAQTRNIPIMSYFNSWQNSPGGTWVLDGERLQAFSALLSQSYEVKDPHVGEKACSTLSP